MYSISAMPLTSTIGYSALILTASFKSLNILGNDTLIYVLLSWQPIIDSYLSAPIIKIQNSTKQRDIVNWDIAP